MRPAILIICLALFMTACEGMYNDDGIPRIRTQKDVDSYNANVSSESEKLVCTRETVVGSNMRQFVCMTIAQRDRIRSQSQNDAADIRNASGGL